MQHNVTNFSLEKAGGLAPDRKQQAVEVAVFLFLVVPSLVLSLLVVQQENEPFPLLAAATVLRDLALVCLICYFLWRNGEPLARIGWTGRRLGRELLLGAVLYPLVFLGAAGLDWLLLKAGLHAPTKPVTSLLHVRGPVDAGIALFLVVVVAVAEETIFRGYLLLRLRAVLGNTFLALLLSSAIFAIGHGYEGSASVVAIGALGFVFGVVYLWRGSLAAPMMMHFLQDFLGLVLAPLLGWK